MGEPGEPLASGLEIAVVGMSGRFPGASSVQKYWENLRQGKESVRFFAREELLAAGIDSAVIDAEDYVPAHAAVDGVEEFDAEFFQLAARDADLLDPQQRLLLECAWEALEEAGHLGVDQPASVGVFTSVSFPQYLVRNLLTGTRLTEDERRTIAIWNDKDHTSTRISYKLGLTGPSVTVQTACSSSLVAVHQAVQALLAGDCDLALAGGMTVRLPVVSGYRYRDGGVDSRRGHCRAFDAEADGMVPGSGGGLVVLRRLDDARADRDTILAVIRGSAVNNDGNRKVGYTAPSVEGQARVIRQAHAVAGVSPGDVTYVEAHGTGTRLGDPIEVAALTQAFGASRAEPGWCRIGSAKTNIGHLDVASGIAGLIKTVLALRHKEIPPSLNYATPNPEIDFMSSPFRVAENAMLWRPASSPRIAGVSSFGIGGTNAHVVLQEAPADEAVEPCTPDEPTAEILPLSARSATALDVVGARLLHRLEEWRPDLGDVAATLQTGRRAFRHRRVVVAREAETAAAALSRAYEPRQVPVEAPRVAFIIPGQGAQAVAGRELYAAEPVFRDRVDECAQRLEGLMGRDIRALLFADGDNRAEAARALERTENAQPALFTIGYSLAELWMSWGIHPDALIGHSVGEYVAACLAGVLTLDDALRLIAGRGRLMQSMSPGVMLAVACGEPELSEIFATTGGSLAAVNDPNQCVASGTPEAMERLAASLGERGIDFRRVATSHAFHSEMMDQIMPSFRHLLSDVKLRPPQIRYQSNLTGTWITDEDATDPAYWARQLRCTVRFADGLAQLAHGGPLVCLELGTKPTLTPITQRQLGAATAVCSIRGQGSETVEVMEALGAAWCAGVTVDWPAVRRERPGRHVPLPTYPFERRRHWVDPRPSSADERSSTREPEQRKETTPPRGYVPFWRPAGQPRIEAVPDAATYLVVGEHCGTRAIVERLRKYTDQVVTAPSGSSCASLFTEQAGHPCRVIYVCPERPWSDVASAGENIFNDLLSLVQAIARGSRDIRLSVVTVGAQPVSAGDLVNLMHAPVQGIVSVLPLECPQVEAHSIDLAGGSTSPSATDADDVLAEVRQAGPLEPMVAIRDARRWVPDLAPVGASLPATGSGIRDHGVYLITGGLGAVGLEVAGFLARSHRARLVLTGRSELPEPESWPRLLADPVGSGLGTETLVKVRALQGLVDDGAELMVRVADVRDVSRMRAIMVEATERFGTIHGVLHLAYVPGGPIILRRTPADVAAEFAPKLAGVLALDHVCRNQELDFFAIFSSLNVLSAGPGGVASVATSTFVDRFSHAVQGRRPYPVLSLNWPMWIGVAPPTVAAFRERIVPEHVRNLGLRPADGLALLERLLSTLSAPQVMVSGVDLRRLVADVRDAEPTASIREPAAQVAKAHLGVLSPHARPDLTVRQAVTRVWQDILGVTEIGEDVDFGTLGGDSLSASQVVARLKDDFGLRLSFEDFFGEPTIGGNTRAILGQGPDLDPQPPDSAAGESDQRSDAQRLLADIEAMPIDDVRAQLASDAPHKSRDA